MKHHPKKQKSVRQDYFKWKYEMPLNPSWIHTVLTGTPVLAALIPVVDRNITIRHLDARPTLADSPDGFVF